MPAVTIVIPCFNERLRLPVNQFRHFLGQPGANLLFVDDGSTDNTAAVLEQIRAESGPGRVGILSCGCNRGKAEAVRRGMNAALGGGARFAGFWDADLATPLDAIAAFERVLEQNAAVDMVFGARVKLLGRKVERRATRHYLGRLFATAASTTLRLPIYDTQCGAKLFRVRPEIAKLFAEPFQSRWVFDVELIARFIRQQGSAAAAARIYEYPLETWVDVGDSKVKASDFATALLDMAGILWRYRARATPQRRSAPRGSLQRD